MLIKHFLSLEVHEEGMTAFAKIVEKKATIKLRHVCPSVRMEKLGSHWTDFHEILYLGTFRKNLSKEAKFY